MREKKHDEAQRDYALIRSLGIGMLALFMLASIAGAAPFAYITNLDNTVSVIDTDTDKVTATVPVGIEPFGVAITPDATKVYVTNVGDNTVSVIDTATNTVTATVNVESVGRGVAMNPTGTKVYVTGGAGIYVIDTATNTITDRITDVGYSLVGIVVNPDGKQVYVTHHTPEGTVSVIDTATNTVTAKVKVGSGPWGIAVNPEGTKVYVTNRPSNNISVIDTATNTVIANVDVEKDPSGVAVNPKGTKVYVTNSNSGTLSVIDTATNTVTNTVDVGSSPSGVAVNPEGTKVYVTTSSNDTVSVIDTATNTVTATVIVGELPVAFGQFIGPVSAPEPTVPYEINTTQVTTSGSASDPHIYGDRIVYQDSRKGKSNIYMYNVSTKKETQISKSGTAKYPAIYGNRIVWKDDRNEKSDIYMYDLSTRKETKISTKGIAYSDYGLTGPDIYNDKIVWQEMPEDIGTSTNLIMYNLSTQQEKQITTSSGSGGGSTDGFYSFAIHGDKIVMCDPVGDDVSKICVYDISTQKTILISDGKPKPLYPDIYGDRIVYEEVSWKGYQDYYPEHYRYNISMYNLSTQQKIQVSPSGRAYSPSIYSDRIVWEDYRKWGDESSGDQYADIYMYNLSSTKETQITTSGAPYSPEIYENRIVWVEEDISGDNSDIYMCTVPRSGPVVPDANFSASPTAGKAPLKVQFTDLSTGSPTSWSWNFGDKQISKDKNPVHTYKKAGKYTVSLTVKNEAGKDTKEISKYIVVKKK